MGRGLETDKIKGKRLKKKNNSCGLSDCSGLKGNQPNGGRKEPF